MGPYVEVVREPEFGVSESLVGPSVRDLSHGLLQALVAPARGFDSLQGDPETGKSNFSLILDIWAVQIREKLTV